MSSSISAIGSRVSPVRPISTTFKAASNFAEPFGPSRTLRGQFASTSEQELSIREVFFPRSWKFAYQVGGFGGAIFADREAAVRDAFEPRGLTVTTRLAEGDWVAIEASKER